MRGFSGLALAGAALALGGCQYMGGYDPVPMSANARAGFAEYRRHMNPMYFFVSEDGRAYGYSFCPDHADTCRGSGLSIARRSCESSSDGVPCVLYAAGRHTVRETIAPGTAAVAAK